MKRLTCEMCGSIDLVKQDGMYVCQYCGTKYSVEEAKKMMIEGKVDVTGSTVKIDVSDELANLYQIARRAKDDNNSENAAKYYDMIMLKDPTSWEASFYVVYFKAMQCKIAEIQSAAISVANCIDTVMKLIKDNVEGKEEQEKAVNEVALRCTIISNMLYNAASNHYEGIGESIRHRYLQEMVNNCFTARSIMYILGDNIDSIFADYNNLHKISVEAWKDGITKHNNLMGYFDHKEQNRNEIMKYVSKIQKYDSSYQAPIEKTSSGCYVATAVYGSYDCPQVWTLRRYRDYTLAVTWYGCIFIRIYYAISPTLIKLFGNIPLFQKICKSNLDYIVAKLQSEGIASTPYKDIK